jgi:microcystin-dependent protein
MENNINPNSLTNNTGFKMLEIIGSNIININGNLGIGTDIPLSSFHIENINLYNKIIELPTASNIYNYQDLSKKYSLVPTGTIITYPIDGFYTLSNLQNTGWFECNGQQLPSWQFPVLTKVLDGQFGNPSPITTTITLPDFRGNLGIGSTSIGFVGIGTTTYGPSNMGTIFSPSNVLSHQVIPPVAINTTYTIQLNYNQLPDHDHFLDASDGPVKDPNTDGTHTHTYSRMSVLHAYQSSPGGYVYNSLQGSTTRADNATVGHNHDGDGVGFFSIGPGSDTTGAPLAAASINIQQPSIYTVFLMKCY